VGVIFLSTTASDNDEAIETMHIGLRTLQNVVRRLNALNYVASQSDKLQCVLHDKRNSPSPSVPFFPSIPAPRHATVSSIRDLCDSVEPHTMQLQRVV
jgi:hypothetical protein